MFDVGTREYYSDAEKNLSGFLSRVRDDIFLISKGLAGIEVGPDDPITSEQARTAAGNWTRQLDNSLSDLGQGHVDAYYYMAAHNPNLVGAEEMRRAFETARDAGKVSHWGVSTHQNTAAVLAKAVETGWYDLAMIAITPAGWYDWEGKRILDGHTDARGAATGARESPGIRRCAGGHEGRSLAGGPAFSGWR